MPRCRFETLVFFVLLSFLVVGSQTGLAAPPPTGVALVTAPAGGFAIDGDLFANTPTANAGDWVINSATGGGVLTASGVPLNASTTFHFTDPFDTSDIIFAGGLKWTDNPTNWSWTVGKANGKTDINNVLLHTTTDSSGHSWVAIAADRESTSGDSYIDFELLQNTLTRTGTGGSGGFTSAGPHGGRTTNDLVLSLAFTSGGSVADFFAWRWMPNGSGGYAYVDVTTNLPVGRVFVALNATNAFVPYKAFNSTNYAPNAFAEAAVDLTALLGNFDPCLSFGVKTLMVKTKNSQSSSASISDLLDPIQLTLQIGPSANAGPDQTRCTEGASTLFPLNGSATPGLYPIVSTAWSVVSGTATIDSPNSLTTSAHVSSASATLRLTALQANGCTETDDVVLTVAPLPACSITGPSSVCPMSTRQFSATTGMSSYAWSVTGNASISGPTNQQTVSILASSVCSQTFSLSLTVTSNLCSSACTKDVTIGDTNPPSLVLPADRVLECPADTRTNATGVATAQDNCGLVTVSFADVTTDGCGGTKVIARTWTATDLCGNSTNSVQTITVTDTTKPTITCPVNKTVECTSNWTFDVPTASDTCGSATITILSTVTNTVGHCGNTFDATRTWRATDACGNTADCSQKVTLVDTTKPTITCVLNKTVECTSAWDFDAPTASDTCGDVTIAILSTVTNTVGRCGNTFDATRTWRATDACGNTSDCSQKVTLVDTTKPTITCVPSKTVEYGNVWSFDAPTASDTCGTVTITILNTVTNTAGHCGNTFDATRTWRATDACGNTADCSQTVTVEDHTPPTLTCVAAKTVECTSPWDFNPPTATDIGGTVTITILNTVTNTAGHCGNTFDATRTWRATDACGNTTDCSQQVTLVDTTKPTITCVPNKSVECTSPWDFDEPTASDTCGTVTITILNTVTNLSGHCGNTLDATRTWRATDACGNTADCSQKVTVVDTTKPTITCVPNKSIEFGSTWGFDVPTASDTCGTVTIAVVSTVTNTVGHCGNTFDATRTWRATDACGNTAECSQKVTVEDHTPPTLTCVSAKTVECTSVWTFDPPTATDIGGNVTIAILNTVTNTSGHCGNTFDATRTWRATDACGNTSDCSQTVTVEDHTPPSITCVPNKTIEYGSIWNFDAPTASDTCGTVTIAILNTVTNTAGHCGNTFDVTRTWRAIDACGNTADCSQKVTVEDHTPPTITCVFNKSVECTSTWGFDPPSASDIGGNVTITILNTVTNTAGHCGNTFDATRTWRATDACGNTSDCSQTVTIVDTTKPTITCVPNKTVEYGNPWAFDAPTASDTCGTVTVTILNTVTNTAGHCGNTFDTTRTWRATDACGNTADCSQTVTIEDHTPPAITCVANKTVECTSPWAFDAPTATDIGGTVTITILNTVTNTAGHCGNTFAATRTWRATDACGNTTDCSQTVTVVDTTKPTLSCVPNKTVEYGSTWTFNPPTASDSCGSVTVTILNTVTNTAGHCGNTFDATRTWRATDACGNTAECGQTVTVEDHTPPTLTCVSAKTVECTSAWTFDAPTAIDAGGNVTITILNTVTNTAGHCGNTFDATRTWRATDACGNSTDCSQKVTVVDTTKPTINCVPNKAVEYASTWDFDAPTASDTCGSATITLLSTVTNFTGHCGNTFDVTRTWRATDACGNTADCSQKVTVEDHTPPTITCVSGKTVECTSIWTFDPPIATDTGGNVTIAILNTLTNRNGHCGNTFDATRTWRATDACGNTADCSQTVTLEDHTAPVISCASNKTVECTSNWSFNTPTATDTCGSATITIVSTVTNFTGHCGNTFDATRTWRATDACGNFAECSQTVTLQDTTKPVINCVGNKTVECTSPWDFDAPTASDTCGNVTITIVGTVTNFIGHCGNTFDATRTWRATDACGNTADCSQKVTLVDTTKPTILCVPNKTVECSTPWTFDPPTASDTCGNVTITVLSTVTNTTAHCGGSFDVTRTWRATDDCGNTADCSQKVTLEDHTPPVITCPPDVTRECGSSTAPASTGTATAQDTCGAVSVTFSDAVTNLCGGSRVITRTWKATDGCGNTSTCVQTITVRDTTPPALTLPANRVLECPGDTRTNVTGVAVALDVCSSVTLTFSDVVSNSCALTRTVLRQWTATDACGNSTNGLQTITVVDTRKPSIAIPNISVQCADDVPAPHASLAAFLAAGGTTSDTCSPTLTFSQTSDSGLVGRCPGTVTRVYRVTDECGNFGEVTQRITVDDTIPPVLTCPTNAIAECSTSLDPTITGRATANDNCSTNVSITYSDSQVQSSYSVNFYAADPEPDHAPYLPTYVKLAPASLPCPASAALTGRAADPLRNAVAFGPNYNTLDALTSLSGEGMYFGQVVPFEAVITMSGAPGPERGTIEFSASWSTHTTSNDELGFDKNYMVYCAFVDTYDPGAIDPDNNARVDSYSAVLVNPGTGDEQIKGTFRVSGLDVGDQVVVEIWVVLKSTAQGHAGGGIAAQLDSAAKYLNPPVPVSIGSKTISINANKISTLPAPQPQPPLGPPPTPPPQPPGIPLAGRTLNLIDRTWTATDDCANSSTCVQRITVIDSTPPVLSAPPDLILECPAGTGTNVTGVAVSQDACGKVSELYYSDIVTNRCAGTKVVSRTWTATDDSGNSTNVVQTITVVDTTKPSITCPANTTVECNGDTSPATQGSATGSDACGNVFISHTDAFVRTCGNTGVITRTWMATDECGNFATCDQIITVVDTTKPSITCPANTIVECTGDTSPATQGFAAGSDTCGAVVISHTDAFAPGCGNTGVITRTWMATDDCGNFATCAQTITIVDTTKPSITCPANTTVECTGDTSPATQGSATGSDTCGSVDISHTDAFAPGRGNTGVITRTWKATDNCGNFATCKQTITIVDTTAPTISKVPDAIVECTGSTDPSATGTATGSDTCGTVSITHSDGPMSGQCGSTGSFVRTWTATDACGNTAQSTQTITVVDTTAPTISKVPDAIVECTGSTDPSATGTATGSDTCGSVTITHSDGPMSDQCGGTGSFVRTWTATDACGNTAQSTQTITLVDTTAPTISKVPDAIVECAGSTDPSATGTATGSDTCGTVTITHSDSPMSGQCGNTGSLVRTWTATDACGNTAQSTQTITLVDTTAPTISKVPDAIVECTGSTDPSATGTATGSDTCGTVTITHSDGPMSGQCGNTGSFVRTWTATDACGNTAQSTQTITVVDTTAPTISKVPNAIVECTGSTDPSATGTATGSDTCGTVSITHRDGPMSGQCGNTGSFVRTWTATDACGNTAQSTQTITIVDTTAPTITCVPNKTVECTSAWSFDPPTASDTCGIVTITILNTVTNTIGHCGNTFDATRTWRATDACGNTAECSQTVTVEDHSPPAITCVPNKTVECTSTWSFDAPSASDTCGTVTITIVSTVTNLTGHCGNTFDATRTWRATDACGNTAECSQTVTVEDHTPPTISCVPNKTVECSSPWSFDAPTASDNCGAVTLTVVGTVTNHTGHCGNTFVATRTWRATDACGNSAECSQTVTLEDHTPPTIACAPNKTVECGSAWSFNAPTATDSCGSVTVTIVGTVTNFTGQLGNTFAATRTWRATDVCGNTAECSQTVTVADRTPPVITCVTNTTVECGTDWNLDVPTVTDTCGNATIAILSTVTNIDALIGGQYDLKFYVADPDSGTGPYAPTYLKLGPDSLPCPDSAMVSGRALDPLRNAVAFSPSGALDALMTIANTSLAYGQIVPFEVVIQASGGPGRERGTIEFTADWSTYTTSNQRFGYNTNYMVYCAFVDAADPGSIDPKGNARVDSFRSVVINRDTIAEKIRGTFRVSGLDDGDRVIVEIWMVLDDATSSHFGSNVAADLVSAQKLSDPPVPINVGAQTDSISVSKIGELPPPQEQPPLGPLPPQPPALPGETISVIDRTWIATDDSGNTSTCVQRITVRDTSPPALSVPADLVLDCPADTRSSATGMAVAQDTCGSAKLSYTDIVSNGCGTNVISRVWTATDDYGNSTNAVQTITVRDTSPPVLTCAPNKTVECGSNWSFDAPVAADACGSATITIVGTVTNFTGHCGHTFDSTRTWRATDGCGNLVECSQTVTVEDHTPPTISCVPNKIVECTSAWSFDAPTANDACGEVTTTIVGTVTNLTGHCGNTFDVTRTWRATDACGNTAECSQTVRVEDHTPPTIACAPSKTVECTSAWSFDAPTASDACGNVTLTIVGTVTNLTGHCGNTFDATRTWRATDACGNTAECSQTVKVEDHTPPTLTCAPGKTVECTSTWSFDAPTASDACGNATITVVGTVTNLSGQCANAFNATRTWRATDACGNTAECSQTVTVEDHTPPTLTCAPNKTVECNSAWSFDAPTASDACGNATITIVGTVTNISGQCANTFDATRTWRATDACGNTAECSQTVSVRDTTPPLLTCKPDRFVQPGVAWNFEDPVATDTCSDVTVLVINTITNTIDSSTMMMTRTWQATDACGNTTTCEQAITVSSGQPPVITSQPLSQTRVCGSDATLSVSATGSVPMTYQWRCNHTDVVGATNSSLTFASLAFTNAGLYDVVVRNPVGAVTSSTAQLTVVDPPDTTAPTVSATVPANEATGVGISSQIAVTFSEAMDASSINASTFTLKQGTTPVAGTVNYSGLTATFTPASNLAPLTTYTATIAGARDLAGNALAADFIWSFTTGIAPDTTAPTVSATVPANTASGVGLSAQIASTFSEAMDASTINTSTFTLKQGTTPVAGTVNYSGITATFTPAGNLAPLTTYTATITGARDLAGNALAADFVWSFTTGIAPDTTAPTVSATVPANTASGVGLSAQIASTFSEAMDASTINTSTFTLKQGTTPVGGTVNYSGITATFTPAGNLAPLTTYTATITGARDLAGNALAADFVWSFTTGVAPDTTAPTVSATVPANTASGVGLSAQIASTFSEAMDASTINTSAFTLKQGTTPVGGTVNYSGITATFTPAGNLAPLTTYTATITGARDLAGNALAADFVWSFTTGTAPDTTAPTVSATVPANTASGVGLSAQIASTFSEAMDASTINTSAFTLKQGTTPVAGTVNYSGITATFTPAGNLAPLTTYTATINGARDLAGNALAADFVWSFTTGIAPDTTAPTVSATVPANTTSGVGLSAQIVSTFSEAMDASSINTSTFTLKQGTTPVAGTVNYSGITATFTPAGNLAPLTTYTATINGARDLAGNALAADFVWRFTTGIAPDTTAPTVSATVPANTASGVGLSAQIASTFSEAMDASTINTSTFTLKQGTTPVAGTVNYSGITATFTPAGNLAPLTTYTATINGARDLAGNALAADFVWSFTTGIAPDTTAPTVSATVPANTASGVGLSAQIASTFSEAMDASTINTSTFTLKQGTTPVAGTVNYSGITATFTPAGNLAPLTTYTATINGARDLAGNALAADFVWSFTTGIAPDTTAPTVSATVPANTASGVGLSAQIASTFSEAMDASTINTSTFTLKQGSTPVAGTVSYSGITATFTPVGNLAPLTTYTATITGARDLAGNALAADFVWRFTTGIAPDTTAPTVSATVPANTTSGVGLSAQIVSTFSEAMDASTINTSTFNLKQGTTPVAGTVNYSGITATFTPAGNLAPLTTFTATITGARDLAGNALAADFVWSFTTGIAPDTTAPVVGTTGPANTDTNVPLNEIITASFSEAMDASTINTSTFTVMQGTMPVAGTVSYVDGTATFTPVDSLAPLTTYTATITGAEDMAGNALSSDMSWSFTTGVAPDSTAPVLGATGPANAATDVPLNETITATFSESMDPSTINTNTFTVMQGTTPVAGTVNYVDGNAVFTPADTLAPLTTYTATISTGAKDAAGNPLSTDMSWSFTTGVSPDTTAPTAYVIFPANADTGVAISAQLATIFSEVMDPSTINTSTFTLRKGATPVAGVVSYADAIATFTPADTLAPLTTYTATISTGAKDLAGNPLTTDMSWSFTTGVAPDATAPVLSATGPANDATNVPLNDTITVSFSEAMDPSTINTNTFIVMQGTAPVAGTVTYTNGTAIFIPADTLAPLTTYTVTISTEARDLAGNALSSDVSWSFATGVAPDTTAPVVGTIGPANTDTNVPLNAVITATFSEAMDASTINTSIFTVMHGTTPVAGTVNYLDGTATFTPATSLAPLTTYTATISTAAKDLAGNALTANISWSFTTVSSTPTIVLESAAQAAGPYGDVAGQVVDLVTKIITVPQSGSMQFYRIRSTTAGTITAITISGNNVVLTYK